MIIGIGSDIVDIKRIEKSINKFGQKFINASTASLLFGLEGVFALLIGVFFVGEVLKIIKLSQHNLTMVQSNPIKINFLKF